MFRLDIDINVPLLLNRTVISTFSYRSDHKQIRLKIFAIEFNVPRQILSVDFCQIEQYKVM